MAKLYMLLSLIRSGSTALLHALAQHPDIRTATNSLRAELRHDGDMPNFSCLDELVEPGITVVYRASFGGRRKIKSFYTPFRTQNELISFRPLFLFRNPVDLYGSWKASGLNDVDMFLSAYVRFAEMFFQIQYQTTSGSRDGGVVAGVCYEALALNPDVYMRYILQRWGLGFYDSVLNWQSVPGISTITADWSDGLRVRRKLALEFSTGMHSTLVGQNSFIRPNRRVVPAKARDHILDRTRSVREKIQTLAWDGRTGEP